MTGPSEKPRSGDVLIARVTATLEHDVTIVPETEGETHGTHEAAVVRARELAGRRGVDVWLTEDHTHFVRIESRRSDEPP